LGGLEKALKIAVNDEFALPGDALKDGDAVDLLPPFGGG
jgi:molybdopterin converting factor small subunit